MQNFTTTRCAISEKIAYTRLQNYDDSQLFLVNDIELISQIWIYLQTTLGTHFILAEAQM